MRATPREPALSADVTLPDSVASTTTSMRDALADAELVVVAVPSHGCRAVMRTAAPLLRRGVVIVSATKGLEADTLLRMSEVIAEEPPAGHPVVVLSGPSFAVEVARGCRPRSRRVRRRARPPSSCRRSSAGRTSGCTAATMWSASRSAAR